LFVRNRAADVCRRDLRARGESATQNERKHCKQRNYHSQIAERFFCIQKSNFHSFTPQGDIRAKKELRIRIQTNCLGLVLSFTPSKTGKNPNP